jgi:subtilisin family serine protease
MLAHESSTAAVAVLDSGIDFSHPDLNAVDGINCIEPGRPAIDDNGHGTHVAGIIAARNSGSMVTGVAPGTRVVSVKVLDARKSGRLSQILCGIDWVTANARALGIRVVNMSLGAGGSSDGNCGNSNGDAEHRAICRSVASGLHYVVSAGNGGGDLAREIPAAYPEVLTVTATSDSDGVGGGSGAAPGCKSGERDDQYATYSNYANSSADAAHTVAAPGTCILSDRAGGGTTTYYGTSQATPHVAGTVALCLENGGSGPCNGLSPSRVIARIRNDAAAAASRGHGFLGDPTRPVSGRYFGHMVDAAAY